MADFHELALSEPVRRSLDEMGFEEPTPVQARAIPPLLAGRDVVAQALTGTGKTAALASRWSSALTWSAPCHRRWCWRPRVSWPCR